MKAAHASRIDAAAVKAAINPLDFYTRELGIHPRREHGWIDGGLCCFHADTRAGSFKLYLDTGGFHCFSCGASGGSVIDFLMARYQIGFREALARLADFIS